MTTPLLSRWPLFLLGAVTLPHPVSAQSDTIFHDHPVVSPTFPQSNQMQSTGIPFPRQYRKAYFLVCFPPADFLAPGRPNQFSITEGSRNVQIPETASPFVGETFFPQLTALIFNHSLPPAWERRLIAYQRDRERAADQLRAVIAAHRNESRDAQLAALVAFSTTQAPTLARLDAEGQDLHQLLQEGGLARDGFDWIDLMRLRARAGATRTVDDFVYLRAVRHFAPGLSPAQRDLIGEIMLELKDIHAHPSTPERTVLVSAAGTRLQLPAVLPLPAASALAHYLKTKGELKRELLDLLLDRARDRHELPERTALEALATQQEPVFATLESYADQLREAVAAATPPGEELLDIVTPDARARQDLADACLLPGLSSNQRRLLIKSAEATALQAVES